ncbi:ATP-grasp domain-containing protein [Nocardia sp. NPDC005978]|uniref:ATP-grasp domain-containing protein n=1 Tax=Nocardia sp. NPDC005978 TaxID=3156725 RepID=UPI0033B4B49F
MSAQIMRLLRENPDEADVMIYAGNVDPGAVALLACDVPVVEPRWVDNDEYARFALDFCLRNGIDVLIPSRRLEALAHRAADFAAVGTSLMCAPAAAVRALVDKARTYEIAGAAGVPVPPWRVVSDADELFRAVGELAPAGEKLCIKPSGEYSAFGFRILDDRPLSIAGLLAPPQPVASVDQVAAALRVAAAQGERVPELMVMPYLDAPEVSIDCLSGPGGELLVAIPRAKHGRFRTLLDDPALVDIARRLITGFELPYLSNVQLRYLHGEPVLLEVNPRASAGLFQTAFAGVNLPWSAIRLLLHGDSSQPRTPRLGVRLAVTEAVMEVAAPRPFPAVPARPRPTPAPAVETPALAVETTAMGV